MGGSTSSTVCKLSINLYSIMGFAKANYQNAIVFLFLSLLCLAVICAAQSCVPAMGGATQLVWDAVGLIGGDVALFGGGVCCELIRQGVKRSDALKAMIHL